MSVESLKTDAMVYIGTIPAEGITSLEIEENQNVKPLREICSDKVIYILPKRKSYIIKIEMLGSTLTGLEPGFSVVVERDGESYEYKNCCYKSLRKSISNGKLRTKAEITSTEKEYLWQRVL